MPEHLRSVGTDDAKITDLTLKRLEDCAHFPFIHFSYFLSPYPALRVTCMPDTVQCVGVRAELYF